MRFDIINSEVTPKIKKFTDKYFTNYENHYSVSNGTAQALFGMFYSLPSSYMDTFAKSKVSPIFLELLKKRNYQINYCYFLYMRIQKNYPYYESLT